MFIKLSNYPIKEDAKSQVDDSSFRGNTGLVDLIDQLLLAESIPKSTAVFSKKVAVDRWGNDVIL
jgi:hypothetical protein